jgi:hypothetical protein
MSPVLLWEFNVTLNGSMIVARILVLNNSLACLLCSRIATTAPDGSASRPKSKNELRHVSVQSPRQTTICLPSFSGSLKTSPTRGMAVARIFFLSKDGSWALCSKSAGFVPHGSAWDPKRQRRNL